MQVEETQTSDANLALKPTRAGFIRSLPLAMPVEEVIERGREVGVQLQPSDVHAARYYMRQASAAEAASKPPTIAQQLMLGGTISAQRDQDETLGLTKIAGVRNGAPKPASNGAAAPGAAHGAVPGAAHGNGKVAAPAEARVQTREKEARVQTREKEARVQTREKEARVQTRAGKSKKAERSAQKSAQALVEMSIDDVLKSVSAMTAPKGRGGRRSSSTVNISLNGPLEEQLHQLVVRLGTQRAREIIDAIEETALSAS